MPRIAVINAFNAYNYGMYSVDLAADFFFRRLKQPFTPVVTQNRPRVGRLKFKLLRDTQDFAGFDTVVFWGDFLNNPVWGSNDYANREMTHHDVATRRKGLENWCELYLRLKQHYPAMRILAVGGCFLGADQIFEPDIRAAMGDFLNSAELIAPRDERSLQILRNLAPHAQLAEGTDCAWLLPFARWRKNRSGYFVYFFGRTLGNVEQKWIYELSRRTGLRAITVDWLKMRSRDFMTHLYFRWMHWLITRAAFVVTDTYHFALNTLNRHTRAVCLYNSDDEKKAGTLRDAKKPLLLRQIGLPQLLVDVRTENSLADAVYQRLQLVSDNDVEKALATFQSRRENFRQLIENALTGSIAPVMETKTANRPIVGIVEPVSVPS